jgi:hypothetical protein
MSMKGILWAVLAPDQLAYTEWLGRDAHKPEGFKLQRCKLIRTMLDVYQAQKGAVEVIMLPGWEKRWRHGQVIEILRRLGL